MEQEQSLVKKWLDALRSGKYKQGLGRLRNVYNEFCCLGVLCDIVDNSQWQAPKPGMPYYSYSPEGSTAIPPLAIRKLLGMLSSQPINNVVNYSYFMWLNDLGQNFTEIAKEIEKKAKVYYAT